MPARGPRGVPLFHVPLQPNDIAYIHDFGSNRSKVMNVI
jgi:hypothetical protein